MQSAAVLWRKPERARRQMGTISFLASQVLLIGSIASACLHGPLALFCLFALFSPDVFLTEASVSLLIAGYVTHCLCGLLAPGKMSLRRIWLIASAPVYWPLQSIAAMRAIYELAKAPHAWSKTPHALTVVEYHAEIVT